ncbi:MAG: hypothetical protein NTY07_19570 [Bacteroidia bacterium]|nr:hypothetical protein [Bacteroidia bacterium]
MRRLFFAFVLVLSANIGNAQLSKHAIGLRLGGGDGFGTEISYQHALTDRNRLEFDLGMYSNNIYSAWGLAGIYQWVWNIEGGFNWYAGAGGRIGSWSYSHNYIGTENSGIFLAAAGNIGIEYSFPVGIQLALDARPEIGLINRGDAFRNNIAFSVRYQF